MRKPISPITLVGLMVGWMLLCSSTMFCSRALSAPNTDDPGAVMQTRDEPQSKELVTTAAQQYQIANDILQEMVEKAEAGMIDKIDPRQFGKAWVAIIRMNRLGKHLENLGETAGVDFQIRSDAMRITWRALIVQFEKEASNKIDAKVLYNRFSAELPKRAGALARINSLIDQQNWEEAWTEVNKEIEELETLGCWFQGSVRPPLVPFEEASGIIASKISSIQQANGKKQLLKLRGETAPQFDKIIALLRQAAKDIRDGKTPTLDGQSYSSVEIVSEAGNRWQQMHLASLQCQGLDLALSVAPKEGVDIQNSQKLVSEYQTFSDQLMSAIGEIVKAEAATTSAEEAPKLYVDFLRVLGPLLTLTKDPNSPSSIVEKLELLASVSPSLTADMQAYDAATSDLLRWRKRLADAQQRSLASDFAKFAPTAASSLKLKPSGVDWYDTTGFIKGDPSNLREIAILSPVPQTLNRIKTELVGKQVALPDAIGLNPAKRLVTSRYQDCHYATFTLPDGYDSQVANLKAELLVSDNLPPLTLKAAMAIAAAERGDLRAAGVTIKRVYVEPLATRMATLPSVASVLVPLGTLPELKMTEPPVSQVLLRSDVQADWVRNEYFLVTPAKN